LNNPSQRAFAPPPYLFCQYNARKVKLEKIQYRVMRGEERYLARRETEREIKSRLLLGALLL